MDSFKSLFVKYMSEHDIKFTDLDDRAVKLSFSSKVVPNGVTVFAIFDKENHNGVHLVATNFVIVPEDKFAAVLMACNESNAKFRWVKFYVNDKLNVCAEADAIIDAESGGREVTELAFRISDIVDDAFPAFMKAVYS